MAHLQRRFYLTGRALLALIFIVSGLGKIPAWDSTTAYMSAQGMPLTPLFLAGAIVLEVVGGLSVMLGYKPRLGVIALVLFLIPATFIFHNFWAVEGIEQQTQMAMFLKNLSILGGLLVVYSMPTREKA